MKKNRMMRTAAVLLVAVLLTTSVISGTFAKYTTSASSWDSARVANWGFERTNSMDLTNLFLGSYTNVASNNGDDVIAPGTEGSTTFSFAYDGANGEDGPEVAYTFEVKVEASCDNAILANKNILWQLDNKGYGSWDKMIADITALSGSTTGKQEYAPNTLPAAFTDADEVHTISWKWIFDETAANKEADTVNGDDLDTAMGNDDALANCSIKITITATQVD